MYASNDGNRSSRNWSEQHAPTPVHRSFHQIAKILSERERVPISSAQVEQLCHRAEAKLLHALLRDAPIRSALHRDQSARGQENGSGGRDIAGHINGKRSGRHGRDTS